MTIFNDIIRRFSRNLEEALRTLKSSRSGRIRGIDALQSVSNDGKVAADLIPQFGRSSLVAENRVGDTISRLEGTTNARLSGVYGTGEIRVCEFGRKLVDLVRGFLEVDNKFEAVDVTLNIASLTTGYGASIHNESTCKHGGKSEKFQDAEDHRNI